MTQLEVVLCYVTVGTDTLLWKDCNFKVYSLSLLLTLEIMRWVKALRGSYLYYRLVKSAVAFVEAFSTGVLTFQVER